MVSINLILPQEILEIIFIQIDKDDKLELVCKYWNSICKQEKIQMLREPCVCMFKQNCMSKNHECICHISLKHSYICKAIEHICICYDGSFSADACLAQEHLCICEEGESCIHSCREKAGKHLCICDGEWNNLCKFNH